MYICLQRNKPHGSAITGRLVIDGRWFCDTLERVGYQILPLCYPVKVTRSPKFKRLLPLVSNVPRALPEGCKALSGSPRTSRVSGESGGTCRLMTQCVSLRDHVAEREGIRFHRGSKPEHSTGCIILVADNPCRSRELIRAEVVDNNVVDVVDSNIPAVGCRSAADVERELTSLILKAQNSHEEIILEVTDFRPGTESGYNTKCPLELQQWEIDTRRAEERYYQLHPEECPN